MIQGGAAERSTYTLPICAGAIGTSRLTTIRPRANTAYSAAAAATPVPRSLRYTPSFRGNGPRIKSARKPSPPTPAPMRSQKLAGRQAKITTHTAVAIRIAQARVVAEIPPVFGPGKAVLTSVFVAATSRGAVAGWRPRGSIAGTCSGKMVA
jgi:hypothetical protein